jgi:Tol biopolymer transport system component
MEIRLPVLNSIPGKFIRMLLKQCLSFFLIGIVSFPSLFGQWDFPADPNSAWYTIETDHFIVHYHDGAERTGRLAAKIAEDVYHPVTSFYRYEPSGKVHLIIRDHGDFSNGAAFFYDNKIEIWANALDFDLRGTSNWLRNVIAHEFTHIVQIQYSMKFGRRIPSFYIQWLGYEDERRPDVLYGFPNVLVSYPISGFVVPSWFAEGTAQFMHPGLGYETWDSHRDMILRVYALEGTMLSWNEMSVFGKTSLGNESAYNAGYSLVKYIASVYGKETVREIAEHLASLNVITIDQAIRRATGKSGRSLYAEWQQAVKEDYLKRTANLLDRATAGEVIEQEGFGNFHPVFSPDGKYVAYVSNKGFDYFGLSSLYLRDLETGKTQRLHGPVRSRISWSPDGKSIYFSQITRKNPYWQGYSDLFAFDLEKKSVRRLTRALRLHDPSVSPDGNLIVAVTGADGTQNLVIIGSDGKGMEYITDHRNGEQVYGPRWSSDGATVVYAQAENFNRYIREYSLEFTEIKTLIAGSYDARDPVYSPDGESIYYVSDETGIFNVYRYDRTDGISYRLTNVLGGAFMPSGNVNGDIVYAGYSPTGYKIHLLEKSAPVDESSRYLAGQPSWFDERLHITYNPQGSGNEEIDWIRLRGYNDTQIPDYESRTYKPMFTNTMLVPLVRFDNYIPERGFADMIKPGLYFMTRDMLEKHALFAGATINRKLERDLFAIFEWNHKLPPFSFVGWYPRVSFEIYNITRKTDAILDLREDLKLDVDVTYNLLEFNIILRDYLFDPANEIEFMYRHSRYGYDIGSFILPETTPPTLIQASGELYLKGNTLATTLTHRRIIPTIQTEINPIGRFVRLSYALEFNKFNPSLQYDESKNILFTEYQQLDFHRLEGEWREGIMVRGKHTLNTHIRGGSILGNEIDDFFNFYVGGLMGMQGYPFYSLGGNEYAALNLTYRFPLWEGMDFRLLQVQFERLYGSVFFDYGDAWTGSFPGIDNLKKGAGAELRLETFSFYAYPTRIFFSAAYGFDRFTKTFRDEPVSYGKQWNFYFGILFGFDLGTSWRR